MIRTVNKVDETLQAFRDVLVDKKGFVLDPTPSLSGTYAGLPYELNYEPEGNALFLKAGDNNYLNQIHVGFKTAPVKLAKLLAMTLLHQVVNTVIANLGQLNHDDYALAIAFDSEKRSVTVTYNGTDNTIRVNFDGSVSVFTEYSKDEDGQSYGSAINLEGRTPAKLALDIVDEINENSQRTNAKQVTNRVDFLG